MGCGIVDETAGESVVGGAVLDWGAAPILLLFLFLLWWCRTPVLTISWLTEGLWGVVCLW